MEKFRYAPLRKHARAIRLITLQSGESDDDIYVELHDAQLPTQESGPGSVANNTRRLQDETTCVPEYTALSYVWGTEVDPGRITVSQGALTGALHVTRNLEVALRNLRKPSEARVLWIDAICINQDDIHEKSRQVAFMAEVYKHAQPVLVWLGAQEDDGEFGLEALHYWGSRVHLNWDKGEFEVSPTALDSNSPDQACFTSPQRSKETAKVSRREQQAVYRLINREWWRRLWIRQEVTTRACVKVRCGDSVEFDFKVVMTGMAVAAHVGYKLSLREGIRFARLKQMLITLTATTISSAGSYGFGSLRHALREVRWREPVDAIYAMLDLVPDSDKALGIIPDYTKTTAAVFTEVVVKMLDVNKDATFLTSCNLSSRSIPDLPSWVPDWSSQIETIPVESEWASARIAPHFHLEDCDTLALAAIRKGEVSDVWPSPPDFGHNVVAHILRILPLDLSQLYVDGRNLCSAYAEAFAAGLVSERYKNSDRYAPRAFGEQFLQCLANNRNLAAVLLHCPEPWQTRFNKYLADVLKGHQGRSFIATREGYIGLASMVAQPGDIVFVILGCDSPMLLRPTLVLNMKRNTQSPVTVVYELKWLVVGDCYVPGLKNGEAIYGQTGEEDVKFTLRCDDGEMELDGLQHPQTGRIRWHPRDMLLDAGIEVQGVLPSKRVLVAREALEKAGIETEMVRLI
ncbi:heterokaryon incompatibility protein-domain-containing protein [Microdochium bolleyi]|uniref:Heterokaryon incompatibility protein-domain-containing protein n=1 Tax=Microdochium bolleyi TaxID=196109 RepID=A0A136IKJ6_9PEZI|nr:heterokaryon incompatibility protein-domain-containing protein [Microdochium bolleyi]